MLSERRRTGVVGAEHAMLLQQRHDLVGEPSKPARRQVGNEDETVARIRLRVDGRKDFRPPTDTVTTTRAPWARRDGPAFRPHPARATPDGALDGG